MSHARSIAAALAAALLLAACGSMPSLDPRRWFGRDETPKPATRETPGVDAPLRALGSSVTGTVRVRESGELLIVMVSVSGLKPGGTYRVVFHENGNCSSPNGFSAGPPWTPPGTRDAATRVVPLLHASTEGTGLLTARLRGLRMGEGGMTSRGVLVYEGTEAETPRPSVPNNVVACGVFTKATSLF